MRKVEKKIREDILNEIKVPDILSKIKPYADEQAAIMQEDNRTVRLNFHKPARVLTACLASVIGVIVIVIIGVSINGSSFMAGSVKDARESEMGNNSDALSDSDNWGGQSAPSEGNFEVVNDFYSYYSSHVTEDMLGENELNNYYNEICTYVTENKTIDEVLAIYKTNDTIEHEESIRIIYEYLTK